MVVTGTSTYGLLLSTLVLTEKRQYTKLEQLKKASSAKLLDLVYLTTKSYYTKDTTSEFFFRIQERVICHNIYIWCMLQGQINTHYCNSERNLYMWKKVHSPASESHYKMDQQTQGIYFLCPRTHTF